MGFHEVQFPKKISWGSRSSPGFSTSIIETDSPAGESRFARWESAKHTFDAAYGVKSYEDLTEVKNFFMARSGALNGFRYSDPMDYNSNPINPTHTGSGPGVADQSIGTGNGVTTLFQLTKTYASGPTSKVRTVRKPVAGTVRVYLNGVLTGSGWSVDTTTGIVALSAAPGAGVAVSASYEFDVPARFGAEADKALSASAASHGHGDIDSIPIVELADPSPGNVTEYFYGGAYEAVLSDDVTLSTGLGRLWVLANSASGLSARLPDPALIPHGGVLFTVINEGPANLLLKDHLGATMLTLATGKGTNVLLSLSAASAATWYAI